MKYLIFVLSYALVIFGFAGSILFIPQFAEAVGNLIEPATKYLIKGVFVNYTPAMVLQFFMFLLFVTLPAVLAGLLLVAYDETDSKWFILLFILACIGVIVFDVVFYSRFSYLFKSLYKYDYEGPAALEDLFNVWFGKIKAFFQNLAGRVLFCCMPVLGQIAGACIYGMTVTEDGAKRVTQTIAYPIGLIVCFLIVIFMANVLSFIGFVLAIFVIGAACLGLGKIATTFEEHTLSDGTKVRGSGNDFTDSVGNHYKRDGSTFRKD